MMKSIKRVMGLMAVVGMLMFPLKAIAADGQLGIYVAPKIIYGLTYMKDVKYQEIDVGNPWTFDIDSKWDNTFGGSLAAGYDFSKRLTVPVRAELEYAAFTKADAEKQHPVGAKFMSSPRWYPHCPCRWYPSIQDGD